MFTKQVTLSPVSETGHQGIPRLQYKLNLPDQPDWLLWFESDKLLPQDTLDAAAVCLLQPLQAIAQPGWHLHIQGALSPSLAWHLNEFQHVWATWMGWPVMTITADSWHETIPNRPMEAIASFSGGVDSAFTAYECSQSEQRPYAVNSVLMVHGFDLELADDTAWSQAWSSAQVLTQSLGLCLYGLKTNLAELHRQVLHWDMSYASAVAGCLRLFNQQFGAGLIPSSFPYGGLHFPAGSNPISDPLLSSANFSIKLHGAAYTRPEKTQLLLHWPQFISHLRVCWQPHSQGKNCGQCEKCMRMRLLLAIHGVEEMTAFPATPTINTVLSTLRLPKNVLIEAYQRIYTFALETQHPLAKPINRAIKRNLMLNRIKHCLTFINR